MAYSLDFRRKVLSVRKKEGLTIAEVAARFDIGVASVTRWVKNIHRKPQGFRQRNLALKKLDITYKKNSEASQSRRKRTTHLPGEDRRL
ncbi:MULTISPECIES: IS630 transposase-related protein [Nitrosomonas]|uniref:Transposase n=1 Tax=Nitrosomonas communis TaxID=44574 RepID=A0A5D3YCS8_9PROT|nr:MULTISPECIES: IS630 transposase-related protein [Nitrosomonas]TYP89280.1 transposase [Nitrosomonas communis]UVS60579.1 IS630 transposase-related protein [Nitrosomonas sp. PLL12]